MVSSHVQVAANNTKMSRTDLWSQGIHVTTEKKSTNISHTDIAERHTILGYKGEGIQINKDL